MRTLCLPIAELVIGASFALVSDQTMPRPGTARSRLVEDTQNRIQITTDPAAGTPSLILFSSGSLNHSGGGSIARAHGLTTRFGEAFGTEDPARDLGRESILEDRLGSTHLRSHFCNDCSLEVEGWYIDVFKVVADGKQALSVWRPSRKVSS